MKKNEKTHMSGAQCWKGEVATNEAGGIAGPR